MTPYVCPIAFFVFGVIVGSVLNICIHRLPLGESIVSRTSSCPHCRSSIPWLVTLLPVRGKCRNCGASISTRYVLVELVTAAAFLGCCMAFGHQSLALALVNCVFLGGLIVAAAIDVEHLIIPDEITLGGMIAGVVFSFLLPQLQCESTRLGGLRDSLVGLAVGGGVIYAIVRGGKMVYGRKRVALPAKTKILFSETALHLPDRDVPFDELFYRKSDVIVLDAQRVELPDRCYRDVRVRLTPEKLKIGKDEFNPAEVPYMEVLGTEIVLPREAMGLGDAKLMTAIGAFLGWRAVLFVLVVAALAGSVYGLSMMAVRRKTSPDHIYFGPFLAVGAALWVFEGPPLVSWYQQLIQRWLAL